jgi:prevent-host-death family protein
MPNIKPVSDLRNYTEVLKDIEAGEPVFLTKNGRGRYVIVDMEDYEKTQDGFQCSIGKIEPLDRFPEKGRFYHLKYDLKQIIVF